jgi:hypothetical protein
MTDVALTVMAGAGRPSTSFLLQPAKTWMAGPTAGSSPVAIAHPP